MNAVVQQIPTAVREDGQAGLAGGPTRFVFVGEKRSRRAIQLAATWENGRLAGKTLHEALGAVGLDPRHQEFLNLYQDGEGWSIHPAALARLRSLGASGVVIVGLGRRVQATLRDVGLPYRPLVHPAARGAIRSRTVYQARVAEVLEREPDAACPGPTGRAA